MRIDIYFGGNLYGMRSWDSAPRVGDYMTVNGKKAGTYRVADVIWCCNDTPHVLITLNDEAEAE